MKRTERPLSLCSKIDQTLCRKDILEEVFSMAKIKQWNLLHLDKISWVPGI